MSSMRQIRLVAAAEKVRIRLFGGLRAERGDEAVDRFRTQKTAGLLAYLALHGGTAVGREELIELFWPDAEAKAGQQSFRTALSSLGRALAKLGAPGERALVSDRSTVWLDAAWVETDVGRFERAL